MPSPDELGRLIGRVAANRDRAAFRQLFDFFAPRLKSFLSRSGLAVTAAEEIVQETMLSVWRKSAGFDPMKASVSTWIFTIARNQRIDRLRRESRQAAPIVPDPTDDAPPPITGEEWAIAESREARVRQAIGHLSPEQATILRLSFFAEKSHAEIARELDIPLGTVKSRVKLAMNRLRQLLDADT